MRGNDDVIELSSGDSLQDEAPAIKVPRRVVPKRLSTLGRPVAKKARPSVDAFECSDDEAEKDTLSEVIEISD